MKSLSIAFILIMYLGASAALGQPNNPEPNIRVENLCESPAVKWKARNDKQDVRIYAGGGGRVCLAAENNEAVAVKYLPAKPNAEVVSVTLFENQTMVIDDAVYIEIGNGQTLPEGWFSVAPTKN